MDVNACVEAELGVVAGSVVVTKSWPSSTSVAPAVSTDVITPVWISALVLMRARSETVADVLEAVVWARTVSKPVPRKVTMSILLPSSTVMSASDPGKFRSKFALKLVWIWVKISTWMACRWTGLLSEACTVLRFATSTLCTVGDNVGVGVPRAAVGVADGWSDGDPVGDIVW